jgi:hypothetical protein
LGFALASASAAAVAGASASFFAPPFAPFGRAAAAAASDLGSFEDFADVLPSALAFPPASRADLRVPPGPYALLERPLAATAGASFDLPTPRALGFLRSSSLSSRSWLPSALPEELRSSSAAAATMASCAEKDRSVTGTAAVTPGGRGGRDTR